MENYNCPDCGADNTFLPKDCCDTCILKFYFENPNASHFGDWREPEATVTHGFSPAGQAFAKHFEEPTQKEN